MITAYTKCKRYCSECRHLHKVTDYHCIIPGNWFSEKDPTWYDAPTKNANNDCKDWRPKND